MTDSPLTDEDRSQIIDALIAGKKIEAIRLYRAASGLGLKESKEYIDNLIRELSKEHPGIIKANEGSGCAGALVALLAAALAAAALT